MLALVQQQKQQTALHLRQMSGKDAEIDRLRQYINAQLRELQQRQQDVEERAPLLEAAVRDAKDTLKEVGVISKERYLELRRTPHSRVSLADSVRMAMYEQCKVRGAGGWSRAHGSQ